MDTDILFGSLRTRFSRAQQEAVLAYAKSVGGEGVPSRYSYKMSQKTHTELLGDPLTKVTTKSGNVFYMNSIEHAMKLVS